MNIERVLLIILKLLLRCSGSCPTAKGLRMLLSTLQNRNSSVNLPVLDNFMLYTNRRIEKKRGK